jgi:AMP nucleosidase
MLWPIVDDGAVPPFALGLVERAIAEHLRIGIAAIDELKLAGDQLHSRKLRAFNEPPFR